MHDVRALTHSFTHSLTQIREVAHAAEVHALEANDFRLPEMAPETNGSQDPARGKRLFCVYLAIL